MNSEYIKVGMRVRVEFQDSAEKKIDLADWALARRRNNIEGTVVSRIAEKGGDAWWVQLDVPEPARRSLRREPAMDKDAEIRQIAQSRYNKAPYISAELKAV